MDAMAVGKRPDDLMAWEVASLVVAVYDAAAALRRLGDAEAGIAGQTQARWQVMNVISEGDWTVPRVARRLGVQRQSVQRLVDRLRDDDLVELEPNPDHATSPLLRLTERGGRVLREINDVADRWHRSIASSADAAALRATAEFLDWLCDAAEASRAEYGLDAAGGAQR
jgi:DNA-binding MarR family transcriptional regulator